MGECVYDSEEGEFVDFATLEDWEMRDREKTKRIEALEAKLARAVEAVDEAHTSMLNNCDAEAYRILDTALAELKGETDDQER